MSLARIYTQKFSGKSKNVSTCEGCRQPIEKGQTYRCFKVGFRSRYQHNYHAGCEIKDSARESSKLSAVFAAREDAIDNINSADVDGTNPSAFVDDLRGFLESAADDWDGVASEYDDASEAMGGDYGAGSAMAETAASIEEAANQLRDWSPNEEEPDVNHEDHAEDDDERTGIVDDCDECMDAVNDWADEVRSSATDALTDAEGEIEMGG